MSSSRRRTGQSSAGTSQPNQGINRVPYPPLPEFEIRSQKEKYERMEEKKAEATRMVDLGTLSKLGVRAEIERLLNACGLGKILRWDTPSYRMPMVEFLSSFRLSGRKRENIVWNFRLGNQDHQLRYDDLVGIFGFPLPEEEYQISEVEVDSFWREITGLPRYSSTINENYIQSPVWRMIHRIIVAIFHERGDGAGKVTREDLRLMIHVAHAKVPDVVSIMSSRMKYYAGDRERKEAKIICGGAWITEILTAVGFSCERLEKLQDGNMHLNIDHLQHARAVTKKEPFVFRTRRIPQEGEPDETEMESMDVDEGESSQRMGGKRPRRKTTTDSLREMDRRFDNLELNMHHNRYLDEIHRGHGYVAEMRRTDMLIEDRMTSPNPYGHHVGTEPLVGGYIPPRGPAPETEHHTYWGGPYEQWRQKYGDDQYTQYYAYHPEGPPHDPTRDEPED